MLQTLPDSDSSDAAIHRRLLRDVCYLYHELADYQFIMGDLDYANDYPLEYWTLINRVDDRFVRSGILVLQLAMLQEVFDGSGNHISQHLDAVLRELKNFVPEDRELLRLVEAIEHGVELLAASAPVDERFAEDVCWAYEVFVRGYFASNAR